MKNLLSKRMIALFLVVMITGGVLAGCGNNNSTDETETTSETTSGTTTDTIDPEAVAAVIGDSDIPASEVFYILYNLQATYEMYGITDWEAEYSDGQTYADMLKGEVENSVLQINYLYSLAKAYDVELTDEQKETIETDITSFMDYIGDTVKERYGFTEDNIREIYTKSYMGSNGYEAAIAEIVAEQSDDVIEENKYRTIQHILISTSQETTETDESGETVEAETVDAEAYKAEKLTLAEEVLARAQAGEDFTTLAEEYNEDSGSEYSLNAAGTDVSGTSFVTEFVEAANALGDDEISAIVETEYGFHIIKCITTFDEEVSMTARESVAGNELYTRYETWLEETEYEFKEIWTHYVVTTVAEEETTEETTDTTEETTVDTTAETETTADTAESE